MNPDVSSCFGVRPQGLASEWGFLVSAWSSAAGKEAPSCSLAPAVVAKLELGSSNENGLAAEWVSPSHPKKCWVA